MRAFKERGDFLPGLGLALASTLSAACLPVLTRYGAQRIEPLLFCACTNAVAALSMLPLAWRQGSLAVLVARPYRGRLVVFSLLGGVGTSLALIYGLRRVNAISGVLLLQVEPIYSLALAGLLLGEVPTLIQALATLAILGAIGTVFGAAGALTVNRGTLALLLVPLLWQCSHVVALKLMPPLHPAQMTAARYGYGALVFFLLLAGVGMPEWRQLARPELVAPIIATGVISYALGALTWYGAIRRLSLSWTTALCVPGVPIFSVSFAILFLGERANGREIAGLALAVAGVVALILGGNPARGAAVTSLELPVPPGL